MASASRDDNQTSSIGCLKQKSPRAALGTAKSAHNCFSNFHTHIISGGASPGFDSYHKLNATPSLKEGDCLPQNPSHLSAGIIERPFL